MQFAVVYGTRPEFLKLKLLIDKLNPVVIRINQHSSYTEDSDYYHHIINIPDNIDRLSAIGSAILSQLPQYIQSCTHVICQGDTASAFYSLLCAYQMHKKCIHIEAGMRTYDTNHWEVPNDKLRAIGWKPTKTVIDIIDDMVRDYRLTHYV